MGKMSRVASGILAASALILGPVTAANAATFVEDRDAGSYGSISSGGKFVAFTTTKSLSAKDTNTLVDLYVRDLATNAVMLASSNSSGAAVGVNGASEIAMQGTTVVSDDGKAVVFLSSATNVVSGVADAKSHVYRKDLLSGSTALLDRTAAGTPATDGTTELGGITADGAKVSFTTRSSLATADANTYSDGYLWEKTTGKPKLVSTGTTGSAIGSVQRTKVSSDGTYVAYSHLVVGSSCGCYDLTRADVATGAKLNVTNSAAKSGTLTPALFSISRTGKYVAFETSASYVTSDNANNDIYVWSSAGTFKRLTKSLTTMTQPAASQIVNSVGTISEAQGLVAFSSDLKLTTNANTNSVTTQTAYLASIASSTVEALKPTKAGSPATHLRYTTAIDDAGKVGLLDGSYSLFRFTR